MGSQIWYVGSVKSPLTEWEPDSGIESPSGLIGPGQPREVATFGVGTGGRSIIIDFRASAANLNGHVVVVQGSPRARIPEG
jgi:hypothetical protein